MSRAYKHGNGGAGNTGRSRVVVMIVVLVLLVAVGTGIVYLINRGGLGDNTPGASGSPAASSPVMNERDTFYDGVFVDDIALGGLTREQARQQIEAKQAQVLENAAVTITKDSESWQLKASEASWKFDTDAVLDDAYKQGRIGTSAERKEAVEKLPANPVKLTTKLTADPAALEQKVRDLAKPFTVAPADAAFDKYDMEKPKGERLTFKQEVPGSRVDDDALWAAVQKAFTEGTFGTVAMTMVPVEATLKVADLQAQMQLIGVYESEIRNDSKDRLTNIRLGNEAVNGYILMPGDTFSLNKMTGERTEEKGYKDAPVDVNGIEDVGIAGGVCQISGTLYNASINAGPKLIEIVERNHHSIPSSYMGKGLDATVDYPNKDYKFKNISSKPMLIIMYYDKDASRGKYDHHEHAEIYGVPDPEGVSYKLVSKVTKTLPAKKTDSPLYIASRALKPGQTKAIGGRDGYIVDVYLYKVDKNKTETKVEKLYTDTYRATSNVITYYYKDTKPTPTPTPSPTPEGTAAPVETPTPPPTEPPVEPTATPAG